MATKRDYYDILGVSKTSSGDEIKKAYRKLALEWHPDRNKAANANEKFKEINEAYAVLSDKTKRDQYDQFGHAAFSPGQGFGGQAGQGGFRQGPFTYTYSTSGGGMPFGEDFFDPFEIFEQFFGGGMGGYRGGRQRTRHDTYEITISFMEAVKGVTKEVYIPKGQAGDGTQKKTIKIPAGVETGSRIRFENFDIIIAVAPHKTFTRENDDIIITHSISYPKAVLGGVEEVETIDGIVKIRLQPGTSPGTLVRLRGKGVPHVHGSGSGDEYVKIQIHVPTRLTHEQKELINELEATFDEG